MQKPEFLGLDRYLLTAKTIAKCPGFPIQKMALDT